MSTIKLARIFSDGVILQRGKDIKIWGFADAGENVSVTLAGKCMNVSADENGRFDAAFPKMEKGGPYTLEAKSESGSSVAGDVMIGDVVLVSGQSNMEFPMDRVCKTYPDEWDGPFDSKISTFKVTENGVFGEPIEDVLTGEWKKVSAESIGQFSAVGYFTAKHMRAHEDVAVGIVDISLGGAPIESFMSTELLDGYDSALAEAAKFCDDAYRLKVLEDNEKNEIGWREALDDNDIGVKERFEDGKKILEKGRDIVLPDFFSDTELDGLVGSVWLAKTFTVPKEYVGKAAQLWFGTMVDYDFGYVNGKYVGTTDYTYPPRRYDIPEGLITEGENTVVIRLCVQKGYGRVTPGKLYGIVFGNGIRKTDGFNEWLEGADHIERLGGVWKYLIGHRCEPSPETIFVNWKPTSLYNGMLAPLAGLSVKAFAFYQGESNCQNYEEYTGLTERFMEGLRQMFGEDLPYICVQLPEFNSRMEEVSFDGGKAWRGLMAAQEKCLSFPGFYMVKAYGTGELNDLHPQRKEPIGKAIADIIVTL